MQNRGGSGPVIISLSRKAGLANNKPAEIAQQNFLMLKFVIRYAQWIIAASGFLVFGLTETKWMTNSDLWQKTTYALIDRRYSNRPEKLPDHDVKLVGVVNSSFDLGALAPEDIGASPTLQLMQKTPPWDRAVWAAVLEKLMVAGAKVVVFDYVFPGATADDEVFAKALQKYKDRVVISARFIEQPGLYTQYEPPNEQLLLPGVETTIGYANIWTDSDDKVRHAKYKTSLENESQELASKYPSDYFPNNVTSIDALAVQKFTGKISALPKAMASFIDYQGLPGTYAPLPLERMFVERDWESPLFDGGNIFSNKIVVVGPIAEILHDIHPTPFGDMPGPEVHAQMIAALLHDSWLTEPQPVVGLALALGLMWIALVICLRIKNALFKVLVLVGSTAIFLIACQIAFTYYKLVLPITQPLFCLVITGSFGIVFQYVLEQVERMRYRNVLGRYVSENVAKAVLEDKRSFEESLRGKKKPVTILFSDIRGFTTMTETRDADKLVAQLNEYFGEMVKIIEEKNRGTLQKFIGDAIMAAWGDVYSDGVAVDASRAVTAALQMRPALAKLNEGWKDNSDRQNLAIGIGVNHGEVIYGNIGSSKRMELTVIGDGVNLAARLESATKQFHADILVGETVEALTREQFVFRPVDLLTVKGKTRPVEVFTLLGDRSQPAPAWLEKYLDAVKLYRGRKFAESAAQFESAQKEIGGEDFLCEMYVKRCKAYIEQPPPENWDGSYTLSEK
jgi:adenylate cyclase